MMVCPSRGQGFLAVHRVHGLTPVREAYAWTSRDCRITVRLCGGRRCIAMMIYQSIVDRHVDSQCNHGHNPRAVLWGPGLTEGSVGRAAVAGAQNSASFAGLGTGSLPPFVHWGACPKSKLPCSNSAVASGRLCPALRAAWGRLHNSLGGPAVAMDEASPRWA